MSTLIFDADDTLWENNIYFERAFDAFVDFLDHSHLTHPQIREVLNEIELVNQKIHGYGSINFGKNLQQAYQHLAQRAIAPDDLNRVMTFAEAILEQQIELIDGVEETLAILSARHELALFTKGHPDEQRMKVDRSGLGKYFGHTGIVKEKDAEAYARLVAEQGFHMDTSWMIGNSPRSDINPALEVGLGAVLVPHERTWVLEQCRILARDGARFVRVNRFADLSTIF
ncbi:MAG: HAD family hydrolase [Acidobacteriota bacterium]